MENIFAFFNGLHLVQAIVYPAVTSNGGGWVLTPKAHNGAPMKDSILYSPGRGNSPGRLTGNRGIRSMLYGVPEKQRGQKRGELIETFERWLAEEGFNIMSLPALMKHMLGYTVQFGPTPEGSTSNVLEYGQALCWPAGLCYSLLNVTIGGKGVDVRSIDAKEVAEHHCPAGYIVEEGQWDESFSYTTDLPLPLDLWLAEQGLRFRKAGAHKGRQPARQ